MLVYHSLNIVLVTRPKTFFCVPNRIEGASLNHQILRTADNEVWIQFHTFVFHLFRADLIKIHQTSLRTFFLDDVFVHLVPDLDLSLILLRILQREEPSLTIWLVCSPNDSVENIIDVPESCFTQGIRAFGQAKILEQTPGPFIRLSSCCECHSSTESYEHFEKRSSMEFQFLRRLIQKLMTQIKPVLDTVVIIRNRPNKFQIMHPFEHSYVFFTIRDFDLRSQPIIVFNVNRVHCRQGPLLPLRSSYGDDRFPSPFRVCRYERTLHPDRLTHVPT